MTVESTYSGPEELCTPDVRRLVGRMIGDESDRNIYNKREQINFPNAYIFWMYMREGEMSSTKNSYTRYE